MEVEPKNQLQVEPYTGSPLIGRFLGPTKAVLIEIQPIGGILMI